MNMRQLSSQPSGPVLPAPWQNAMTPSSSSKNDLNLDMFRNPACQYRGVTLWFLNDRLDPDEAEWQLRGFHEAGWGAVITRTFRGIRTRYLSPEWLAVSDRAVAVSKELGMRVFLQHADKNAAGYMASGVPGMRENYRSKLLIRAQADAEPPPNSERVMSSDNFTYYVQTVVPPGQWAQLMAALDLLNEEAIQAYLAKAYDPLVERYGAEFGKTIEGVWVDEPWLMMWRLARPPMLPWTPDLPSQFERDWGYSILSHLPELFSEQGGYRRTRCHFWRTVTAQYIRAYWEPVGRWCRKHGTQFAGHLLTEDTLESQISGTAGIMPFYEYMQLLGIDHLTKNLETWPAGAKFIMTPKQCVSAANQLGREEVLSEIYGVSDQALTFEDRKWMGEWLAVLGVNYRCYHGSFYSMTGCRKRFYPPHLSHQQPWWPENRLVADPMARLSYTLRQGKYAAEILVIHPLDSAHCEYSPVKPSAAVKDMQASLDTISENLLALHRQYDYGDDTLMERFGRVEGARLHVGLMSYRIVVLPSLVSLRQSTARLIGQFQDAGGHVVSVGTLPSFIEAEPSDSLTRILGRVVYSRNTIEALGHLLGKILPPDVELAGANATRIWIHQRRLPGRQILFLFNTDRSMPVDTVLSIRGKGRLDAWDLVSADIRPPPQEYSDGHVRAPLHFEPGSSHLLVLEDDAAPVTVKPTAVDVIRTIPLTGAFTIRRLDPNALTLDMCRFRCSDEPWSDTVPIIGIQEWLTAKKYNGPLELEFRFSADFAPSRCELVMENTFTYQATINGAPVSQVDRGYYFDKGFRRFDVSHQVVAGENVVRIACDFVACDATAIFEPERLYGTELEAVYVIGDFAVRQPESGHFVIGAESGTGAGDLTADGYPFFTGRILLAKELDLPALSAGEHAIIDLGPLQAVLAKVRVNGCETGAVAWTPYRVDATSALRPGRNTVEIELITSLRNLLGPHHYTGPHKLQVADASFTANSECVDWMFLPQRHQLKTWSDAYQFIPLGVSNQACVRFTNELNNNCLDDSSLENQQGKTSSCLN